MRHTKLSQESRTLPHHTGVISRVVGATPSSIADYNWPL